MATAYLVFQRGEENGGHEYWVALATPYTAASGDAAKQAAALEHGDGSYAAVPARSWSPSAFKVEPVARAVKT